MSLQNPTSFARAIVAFILLATGASSALGDDAAPPSPQPAATGGALAPTGGAPADASVPAPLSSGEAADPTKSPEVDAPTDFWINVTPYVWAASIDATISKAGLSIDFDVPFSDILSNLDLAFMIHVEGGYRRAFFYGDYEYIRLNSTVDVYEPLLTRADVPQLLSAIEARDPTFGSGPFLQALEQAQGDLNAVKQFVSAIDQDVVQALSQLTPEQRKILSRLAHDRLSGAVQDAKLRFAEREADVQAAIIAALAALKPGPELDTVEATMKMQIAEFGGGYRVVHWDLSKPLGDQHVVAWLDQPFYARPSGPTLSFDLLAGARYYYLGYDQTISFTPDKFGILPSIVDTSSRYEWVDGVIGGRIVLSFDRNWSLWCRGDAGGFTSTNNSWNVQGGIEWSPLSWLSVVAGYRALGIEYVDDDTFGFDGVLQGPFIGASFTF